LFNNPIADPRASAKQTLRACSIQHG